MKNQLFTIISMIIIALAICIAYYKFCYGKVIIGDSWSAKKYKNIYVLSINNNAEITKSMTDFVKQTKITAGKISGLGAANRVILRFFDPNTKQYVDKEFNEQLEITNLTGNISTKDGVEYLHLHVTLGDEQYNALAGHLLEGTVNGAAEFYIDTIPHGRLERTFSDDIGINFYNFEK